MCVRAYDRVAAVEVDVLEDQRGQAGADLTRQGPALGFELFDRGVDVQRVPVDHRIERETECAELVFHAVAIARSKLAESAEEYPAGEVVARLADVQLHPNRAA